MVYEHRELDRQARLLIRASEPLLRHWLGAARLDQALIGSLYLRQLHILEHWCLSNAGDDRSHKLLVERLAVAIYMTATAWQTASQTDLGLLASLREIVAGTLPPNEESLAAWEEES